MARLFVIALWFVTCALPGDLHEREPALRAERRRANVAAFAGMCPKEPANQTGLYCIAFSRPNDDNNENARSEVGVFETGRFITTLSVDPAKPKDVEIEFVVDDLGSEMARLFGLQGLENNLGGDTTPKQFTEKGKREDKFPAPRKLFSAKLKAGTLPQRDGRYGGEINIAAGKHLLRWSVEVKDGKVRDVVLEFPRGEKAKPILIESLSGPNLRRESRTGESFDTHDVLAVASNIPGHPVVNPYPARPKALKHVDPIPPDRSPDDLPR